MHIGKDHDDNICTDFEVDSWKDKLARNSDGEDVFIDEYDGKEKNESC